MCNLYQVDVVVNPLIPDLPTAEDEDDSIEIWIIIVAIVAAILVLVAISICLYCVSILVLYIQCTCINSEAIISFLLTCFSVDFVEERSNLMKRQKKRSNGLLLVVRLLQISLKTKP